MCGIFEHKCQPPWFSSVQGQECVIGRFRPGLEHSLLDQDAIAPVLPKLSLNQTP